MSAIYKVCGKVFTVFVQITKFLKDAKVHTSKYICALYATMTEKRSPQS